MQVCACVTLNRHCRYVLDEAKALIVACFDRVGAAEQLNTATDDMCHNCLIDEDSKGCLHSKLYVNFEFVILLLRIGAIVFCDVDFVHNDSA